MNCELTELSLLDCLDAFETNNNQPDHGVLTAPIVTGNALDSLASQAFQSGLFGTTVAIRDKKATDAPLDRRLYINNGAPYSALVCGVQGSGKSHTVSVMLENMLIPNLPAIGTLKQGLSGLVLHFGDGGVASLPCEAAALAASPYPGVPLPQVRVFVSKSSIKTMKAIYSPLGKNITVEPLAFTQDELDAEAFRSMMAIGSSESIPLYMHTVLNILRELGESFTLQLFEKSLKERKRDMNSMQVNALDQRLFLLKSFIQSDKLAANKKRFAPGKLTIIDLSDPFIDSAAACALFEIILRVYVRADLGKAGKFVVVDEAHKYLTRTSSRLTRCLVTLIREQRHHGMRIIVSTQEPTVIPPVVLELCSVTILHRFASPAWWEHIKHHVPADLSSDDTFDEIVRLKTGQAIVLAPSGIHASGINIQHLGRRYLIVKTRRRITRDLGASIMAAGGSIRINL